MGEDFIQGLWSRVFNHNEVPRGLIVCGYKKKIFMLLKLHTKVVCKKHLYKTCRIWELGEAIETSFPNQSFYRFNNWVSGDVCSKSHNFLAVELGLEPGVWTPIYVHLFIHSTTTYWTLTMCQALSRHKGYSSEQNEPSPCPPGSGFPGWGDK